MTIIGILITIWNDLCLLAEVTFIRLTKGW